MIKKGFELNKVELMSPAGSFESLAAAINAGADSVYFGVGALNMRSRATVNFQVSDLKEITKRCADAGVKSYLALNIIVYDNELSEIRNICDAALEAGVSAVIASDIAVIQYARSIALPVHISVQANVCNIESVKFYSQFADVMVLARELTLPQVKHIINAIRKENIKGPAGELVQIELFAHGALCVSVSGKCYMSLGTYDSSANRGACFQNCRREYKIIDEQTGDELIIDNKFVMSPKDICTVNVLDQILDAGVAILKLEGRGRSADYVHTVTKVYREAVDAWLSGAFSHDKVPQWLDELKTVFNRGFWLGGYYLGEKMGEWCGVSGNMAANKKVYLGRATKYFSKIKVAEFSLDAAPLSVGEEIMITGPTTGVIKLKIPEMRIGDGTPVENAEQGNVISIPIPEKVRPNDKLFRLEKRKFGERLPKDQELE